MASIDLRPRFIGSGLTGTIDLPPTLSWSDQEALRSTAAATASIAAAVEAHGANLAAGLGWLGGEIVSAVGSLEAELGLRLEQQTAVLDAQFEALERIEAALRQPAKVRAAERLVDVSTLLKQRRYERALPLASEAIADDPLNPASFGAAGWALLGLARFDEARDQFSEAAVAADGDERGAYARRAARLDFGLGNGDAAIASLRSLLADGNLGESEAAAVSYDLAVYIANTGDSDEAAAFLQPAVNHDSRFAMWALVDPLLRASPSLIALAVNYLASLAGVLTDATDRLRNAVSEAEAFINAHPEIDAISDSEEIAGDEVPQMREWLVERRVVEQLRAALTTAQEVVSAPDGLAEEQFERVEDAHERVENQLRRLRLVVESAPRIRELHEQVAQLRRAISDRATEVERLSKQYYDEYSRGLAYTQSLTNDLSRYRGRKRKKKLEERGRASDTHMRAMKRWEEIRRIEVRTDPDPIANRLYDQLSAATQELAALTQPS